MLRYSVLLAVSVLASVSPKGAGTPTPQEAAQDASEAIQVGLSEARELMRDQKWKAAHAKLLSLVPAREEDAQTVLTHWSDFRDGLALSSFWKEYEAPEPKEVVSGKLISWKESNGKIKVRYERGDGGLSASEGPMSGEGGDRAAGDFIRSGDATLHPMLFKGPYTVELEGDKFSGRKLPLVYVDWRWNQAKGFAYGTAYAVLFGEWTGIFEFDSGNAKEMDSSSTSIKNGRPYKFKVAVTAKSISASYNGKHLLKVKRAKAEFGQFGFADLAGIERVTIAGEIEPAWIASLIDARVMRDQARFMESYDPYDELPGWVRLSVEGEAFSGRDFEMASPGPWTTECATQYGIVMQHLEKNHFRKALRHVEKLEPEELDSGARNWLLANLQFFNGKSEEGLETLQKLTADHPEFYEGRLLEARVLQGLRTPDDAAHALESMIIDFPDHIDPYQELGMLRLYTGDPAEARDVVELAVVNGIAPEAIEGLGRTLSRSAHGPTWGEEFTYESKNYVVTSDLSREICFEIADELEKFYKKYARDIGRPKKGAGEKFQVYFFSGSGGYQSYLNDILGDPSENTLGVYSPWLKQLVIWNSPEKDMVMRTVRHEGFHQYLHRITSEAPVWLNEGLAEYFEQARLVRGKWKDDQVNVQHVALLKEVKTWTPLKELVHGDNRHFRSRSGLHYPESWLFVHYLFNESDATKKRIEALLDALASGAKRADALEAAFSDFDWEAADKELKRYVRRL